MPWMLSFMVATVFTLVGAGIQGIRRSGTDDISAAIDFMIPTLPDGRFTAPIFVVVGQFLVYFGSRSIIDRAWQFSIETDGTSRSADPATRGQIRGFRDTTRGRTWVMLSQFFFSTENGWVRYFQPILLPAVLLSVPFISRGVDVAALWGLSVLFLVTLSMLRRYPDRPIPAVR